MISKKSTPAYSTMSHSLMPAAQDMMSFPVDGVFYVITPEDPVFQSRLSMQEIFDGFWLWDSYNTIVPLEPTKSTKESVVNKSSKKRWIEEFDFSDKIQILSSVLQGLMKYGEHTVKKFIVKSKRKSNNAKGKKWSQRRSQYIGVSRNGSSYQVLIAVSGKKTYLGSFDDEKEAAITFDFYSILLHSIEANTNFSYTANSINEMVKNYVLFNNTFNASYYLQSNNIL